MKYWIVTSQAPPTGGGIGTYVGEMRRALTERGHDVLVVVAKHALGTAFVIRDDVPGQVEFSPVAWSHGAKFGGAALSAYGVSNLIPFLIRMYGAPDYIEFQDYEGLAYFALQRQLVLEAGYPQIPIVVRVHGPMFVLNRYSATPRYALPGFWFDEMERFTLEAASLVLSPSDSMDAALREEGCRARPVRAHNPARFDVPEGPDRYDGPLVFLGRASYLKGLVELFEAMQRRFDAGHREPLRIIGLDGDFAVRGTTTMQFLEQRHPALFESGLVQFLGPKPREEALAAMASARAVLVPSHFESFGYAVLEAMAHRRVVLAGGGAPCDYIVDGVNGLLCDPSSPASLDEALAKAGALTDGERAAMGKAAAETAATLCDPDAAVDQLLAALPQHGRTEPRRFPVLRPRAQLPAATDLPPAEPGLLSVVIPCFNLGEYVEDAVTSAVESTYRPLEILVMDDGSTDEATREVLGQLHVPDEPGLSLRVVRTPNQGLSRTRNYGADLARGEFLVFVDADDMVRPTYFARSVAILNAYDNVGMVGCWLEMDGPVTSWLTWNTEFPYLLLHNTLNLASVVHRRDVFRAHGRNNPELITGMEDYDSVLRIAGAGWHGVAIPEKLFFYRYRPNSMVRQFNVANRRLMFERIGRASADLLTDHAVELVALLNDNGPGWAQGNPTAHLTPKVVPTFS